MTIKQMVQLHNFFFFITLMVVPRGTAAPVLLKWFVSRDVPIGAPSSNGTIIPIPISSFSLLVYIHLRKFIRKMDGAKSYVLVRASRHSLLLQEKDIIGRSSPETRARNALFRFVLVLHFLLLKSKGDFSYLESFCGVLCLLFFCTFESLPRDRSSKRERERRRKRKTLRPNVNEQRRNEKMRCSGFFFGLEALALPTSRQRMAVGHDYYQKAKMNIAHGGVCICMFSVILSLLYFSSGASCDGIASDVNALALQHEAAPNVVEEGPPDLPGPPAPPAPAQPVPVVIPELEIPLIPQEIRDVELFRRLSLVSLGEDLSYSQIVAYVSTQEVIERRMEAALFHDGFHPLSIYYQRDRIRGIIFYPQGRLFSPATYRSYLLDIETHGTRASIPYRRVLQALRNHDLSL